MTRRQRRALEALVDGGQTVQQIVEGGAVEMVLRINAEYPDAVIEIVTDRRFETSSRTVVELGKIPRETRRLIRSALIEPRTHGPPPAGVALVTLRVVLMRTARIGWLLLGGARLRDIYWRALYGI